MGMSAGIAGRGGRGHRRRGRHHGLISEINVTPFVDVMLVLLIVFMVAAPLLTAGVPIDLPQAAVQAMPVAPNRNCRTASLVSISIASVFSFGVCAF